NRIPATPNLWQDRKRDNGHPPCQCARDDERPWRTAEETEQDRRQQPAQQKRAVGSAASAE
ncbi:MAG TPA: hypothetical protein VGG62_09880, partial [Terracidiphilus sp.]